MRSGIEDRCGSFRQPAPRSQSRVSSSPMGSWHGRRAAGKSSSRWKSSACRAVRCRSGDCRSRFRMPASDRSAIHQLAQLIDCARPRMSHGQGTLYSAGASWALPAKHRDGLLVVGLGRKNRGESLSNDITDRLQWVAARQDVPIRQHKYLQKTQHAGWLYEPGTPIVLFDVFHFV